MKVQKRSTIAYQLIRDALKAQLPEIETLLSATSEGTRQDFLKWFPEYIKPGGKNQ